MFFRKGNYVAIDFIEVDKPTRNAEIREFSIEGIVVKFDDDDCLTFIPLSSISEIRLIKGNVGAVPRTQF